MSDLDSKRYEDLIASAVELIRHLAEMSKTNPERFETERNGEAAQALRELCVKHPELMAEIVARIELDGLLTVERFRESLEQLRRGERGEWPARWQDDYVSAEPTDDFNPDD